MTVLVMRFLGLAELTLDGIPVHLKRRHSLALLSYLVLMGRPHSREELAVLLSDEVADEPARKLVRNALADLTQAGLGDYIEADRYSIAFKAAMPHTVDIAGLEQIFAAEDEVDSETFEWIAAHATDELLAGFALRDAPLFEAWLLREREHLHQKQTAVAERLLEQYLRGGPLEKGIDLAHRLLAAEPWQEDIHRQLMLLLTRNGQLAAALAQYEVCRLDLEEELGVEPEPETTALYERLRAGPVSPRHNLPLGTAAGDVLFGRGCEVDEVISQLTELACRLLTIVGLGGVGKSCLALEVAKHLAAPAPFADEHPFPDGIILVNEATGAGSGAGEAEAMTAERRIVTAIGYGLGLVFYGNVDPLEQVVAYLEPKRMLLVLDDLGQFSDGVAALREILQRAPGVTLLVTSRAPFGMPEEWTYCVRGLALPDSLDELDQAPASRFFQREAKRAAVRLEADDKEHIARICTLTGGLPLALKTAAGWLGAASCAEVARQLEHGGALLAHLETDSGNGYISIRLLMDSIFKDLTTREQQSLIRLAVMQGHFDQLAAEAVGVSLPMLVPLCHRGLVERCDDAGYVLHPLVRQHGAARLTRSPVFEAQVRDQHASYFARFISERATTLRDRREAHKAIAPNLPNLHAAWDWAVAQQDVDLLSQLWQGVATLNQLAGLHREWADTLAKSVDQLVATRPAADDPARSEALCWLLVAQADALHWQGEADRALQLLHRARQYAPAGESHELNARIRLRNGRILHRQGKPDEAIEFLWGAQSDARDAGDRRLEAHCLLSLSYSLADNGRRADAEAALLLAQEIYHDLDERLSLGRVALHAGHIHAVWGDFGRAKVSLERGLHVSREFRDRPSEGDATVNLGIVHGTGLGWHREADEHFVRALSIAREMSDPHFDAMAHWARGRNAIQAGNVELAAECFERALEIGRDRGDPATESRALHGLGLVALAAGNDLAAEDRAEQATILAIDAGRPLESAFGSLLLGQARERLGRISKAAASYARALTIADELAVRYLRCDATAGLASIALASGDIERGVGYAADVLRYLQEHALAGCEEPARAVHICIDVFDAVDDGRAREALRLGALLLNRRASALPEQERGRYLDAFPERRTVLQRWSEQLGVDLNTMAQSHRVPASKPPIVPV